MKEYALITGTTSGIGYALCERFAAKKINLVLVSKNEELVVRQKEYLTQKYGINVYTIVLDLTLSDSARKIMEYVGGFNLHIDYLVNNAGFNEAGNFLITDIEKELSMIQLHIAFVTELTKMLLPDMVSRGNGRILNIGSTGSHIACPNDAVYAATKAYLLYFSRALYGELRKTKVAVTVVCPGSTRTAFAKKAGIENTPLFKFFVMSPEKVAKKSFKAMKKGRREKVIGLYNKLLVFLCKILPKNFVNYLGKKMMSVKELK